MARTKVAVFVGSLRKDSFNRKLAKAVEKLAPDDFEFTHVRIDNLPLYNQDFDADYPAEPARLKKDVEAADAVLFVTPEYKDRKSVVEGKEVSVRVDLGGRSILKKKNNREN